MSEKLYYVASPYTHQAKLVRHQRFQVVCQVTGELMKHMDMLFVCSPIVYSHSIAEMCELPTDYNYWKRFSDTLVDRCDGLITVQIRGWDQSVGILGEAKRASAQQKPLMFFSWPTYRKFADEVGAVQMNAERLQYCFIEGLNAAQPWCQTHGFTGIVP